MSKIRRKICSKVFARLMVFTCLRCAVKYFVTRSYNSPCCWQNCLFIRLFSLFQRTKEAANKIWEALETRQAYRNEYIALEKELCSSFQDHQYSSVVLMFMGPCIIFIVAWREKPTWCHLFYYLFNSHSLLNMFRPLIRPSSGVADSWRWSY